MFKTVTITLNEAVGLSRMIVKFMGGFEIINFKLSHRLKRQVKRLAPAETAFQEAQKGALTEVIGEERLEELATVSKPLNEVLTEAELIQFNELFTAELESDFGADLLTEDFTDLIGDAQLKPELAILASDVIDFLEEKSFGQTTPPPVLVKA